VLRPEQRFEYFVMKALWIIMWMLVKSRGDTDDERRVNQWRHDYMNAGGGTVETALPKSES
jgi:hypothetical protein